MRILWPMRNLAPFPTSSSGSAEKAEPSERARAVEAAIHVLLDTLTYAECQTVLTRLQAQRPANPTPRAGEVLGTVVDLFERERPRRVEWTVADIKHAAKSEGITGTDKQFYNALGYLARKGRIEQIGYGKYRLVDYGVTITTLDDLK